MPALPGSEWYQGVIGVLVVWRLTHLFQAEDGPWDVVLRLRAAAGHGALGAAMDCFYCLSLWIALPVAGLLASGWLHALMLWLALSAGAIVLDRATGGPTRLAAAPRQPDPSEQET